MSPRLLRTNIYCCIIYCQFFRSSFTKLFVPYSLSQSLTRSLKGVILFFYITIFTFRLVTLLKNWYCVMVHTFLVLSLFLPVYLLFDCKYIFAFDMFGYISLSLFINSFALMDNLSLLFNYCIYHSCVQR